jgi:hypothetical protein
MAKTYADICREAASFVENWAEEGDYARLYNPLRSLADLLDEMGNNREGYLFPIIEALTSPLSDS